MAKVTVESMIEIAAPRQTVFRYVATWRNAAQYVPNMRDVEQIGDVAYGLGTRLRGKARFDSRFLKGIPVDLISEVVQFVENERIVCQAIKGLESSNSWLFAGDTQGTILTSIVTYRLPGYLLGDVIARLLSREVEASLRASLLSLKRILEAS